ncbi:MAG: hypothetical protein MUF22_05540 [Chitinispirillaceae bacterium]|jgi:hypothetical protein|nr:hypothetical protein [Chitinispirillaceae bacterium]
MNVMFKSSAVVMAIASCLYAQETPAAPDTTGPINWKTRTITATGIGAPDLKQPQAAQRPGAMRAAQMIALRNALEIIKGISIDSKTTVSDKMTGDDQVSSSINGFVQGFRQKGKTRYMSDGSVEITVEIPLDAVAEKVIAVPDVPAEAPAAAKPAVSASGAVVFTGLIIDCRGFSVIPALGPRVIDESGKEVYSKACVRREWVKKWGIVGYAEDMETAAALPRSGTKPLRIKAVRADGANGSDIVVSSGDAAKVRSASANLSALSECRVVFVIE